MRATTLEHVLTGAAVVLAAAGAAAFAAALPDPDPVVGEVVAIQRHSPPAVVAHDLLTGEPLVLAAPARVTVHVRWLGTGDVVPVSMTAAQAAACDQQRTWRLMSECGWAPPPAPSPTKVPGR